MLFYLRGVIKWISAAGPPDYIRRGEGDVAAK
jgi:hypothetical protein